jgi:pimeloyl-ACP methyl ester carboxylesterase
MISLENWRQSGRVFTYHHHRIIYHDEGAGPVLLCIHGFPTASWDWVPIWPQLTNNFRVIAADMLGFGFSDKPRNYDYSLFDQTTLHEVLLGHLGVDEIHILAHDYGDTVVQEMLARELEGVYQKGRLSIKSVCLLNGGIFPEVIQPIRLQTLMRGPLGPIIGRVMNRGRFGKSFASIFGPKTKPTQAELDVFWSLITHNQGRLVMHKIIRPYIGSKDRRSLSRIDFQTRCCAVASNWPLPSG